MHMAPQQIEIEAPGRLLITGRDGCRRDDHDGKTRRDETNPSRCSSDGHQANRSKREQRHHCDTEPDEPEGIRVVHQWQGRFLTLLCSGLPLVEWLTGFSLRDHVDLPPLF